MICAVAQISTCMFILSVALAMQQENVHGVLPDAHDWLTAVKTTRQISYQTVFNQYVEFVSH